MGYLTDTSQTLSYSQAKMTAQYIKEHGIIQFLNLLKKFKNSEHSETFWGDEIETHLINIDKTSGLAKLQLNNEYIFENLESDLFELQPEYGGWMIETVPKKPYRANGDPTDLVENIRARRREINALCKDGDVLFEGAVFPMLKVGDFHIPKKEEFDFLPNIEPEEEKSCYEPGSDSDSLWLIKDKLLNPHPRYSTLCENLKARRTEKICMLAPIYKDELTSMEKTEEEPYPGFIYMDDTVFGAGNTSFQITFGTKNIDEARYLTDQLSVFSSIILPFSAASAIFKGKLADTDLRWNVISHSVDSRTVEERDPNHSDYIPKARWSSINRYISTRPQCKDEFNDVHFPLSKEMMEFARKKAEELGVEVDDRLINHLGFLFKQDPLIIYSDKIFVDDLKTTNHFENIQSTNWNNVRFKPPPSFESEVGWRVELRPIEAQLTPAEYASLGMFSYFIVEMIKKREYNFYIPISKVDENIERGHKRDAVYLEKFWFRKNIEKNSADEWIEMTLDEILHGKEGEFVGLFNLIYQFCKEEYGVDIKEEWERSKKDDQKQVHKIVENMRYFELLSQKARGEAPTISKWIRSFVLQHPEYKKDSIVSPTIAADLIRAMNLISDEVKTYQDFL